MTNSSPSTDPAVQSSEATAKPVNPWRCLGGAVVAGAIAIALYNLTSAIALTFATRPIHTNNFTAQRIAAAVRTLVIGMSALGTGIFGLAAFGLFALGIQLLLQRLKSQSSGEG
jgi:hypothetical protein